MYNATKRPRRYGTRYSRYRYARRGRMPFVTMPRQPGISLARYQPALNDQDTYFTVQTRQFPVDSTVGGTISIGIPFSGVSASGNWASYGAIFDQFKVEAVELRFTPSNPNSNSVLFPPFYIANDVDSGTSPTNNADILSYGSVVQKNLQMPWRHLFTIPTTLIDRIQWYDCANPIEQPNILWTRAENTTISQNYGQLTIRYFVKFRGSR